MKEPEPVEVIPGRNVTFTSVIRGTPPFKVGWFRGARELVRGDRCNIYFEDTVAELELFNIDTSQSGEYTCVVSNNAGQTSSTTHLFVKEPAAFVKKLSDHSVEPGKSIILESTYTGTPPISVTWKKDGFDITPSEKCNIVTTEKTCILEILHSTKRDAGQYSCEIENEAGRDVCKALVSTLGVLSYSLLNDWQSSNMKPGFWFSLIPVADCEFFFFRTTLFCYGTGTSGGISWRFSFFTMSSCWDTRNYSVLVQRRHQVTANS